jgi:hypothetical protein
LRHLRLHRRQETDSASEHQRGQGSLSVDGGELLLEQRPHHETRLSGAIFVPRDPQLVCPALLSGSNGSQMEMLATTAQPNDVAQWSRGLHASESSSQAAPLSSGLRREVEKRQQRQREKQALAPTVPDEPLAGVTRPEPSGGVSYTQYGSNMMQPQIDMIGRHSTIALVSIECKSMLMGQQTVLIQQMSIFPLTSSISSHPTRCYSISSTPLVITAQRIIQTFSHPIVPAPFQLSVSVRWPGCGRLGQPRALHAPYNPVCGLR